MNTHTDQCNRTKSLEVDLQIQGQLISDGDANIVQ